MKAARFYAAGDIRIEDVPERPVRPCEAKVRIAWCGLCGTDLGEYRYGPLGTPNGEPHPLTGETVPVILGHEITGTVVEVGDRAEDVAVGARVLVNPMLFCGECDQCTLGHTNLCHRVGVHGLSGGGGGLAEFTVVAANSLHEVPDDLDLDLATLAEPLAVAIRAVRRAGASMDTTVAVFGAGPIGLALTVCLRDLNVSRLVVIDPSPFRRSLALDLGADMALGIEASSDIASAVDLPGLDVVFEASGTPAGLDNAVAATRPGGNLLLMARFKTSALLDPNRLRREINLISTQAYVDEIPEALDLTRRWRQRLALIATTRVSLDDVVACGFERLADPAAEVGKVLVFCHDPAER